MIVSFLSAAVLSSTFVFENGNMAALAPAIQKHRNPLVVIFAPDHREIGKLRFEWDTTKDLNRHIQRLTGLQSNLKCGAYHPAGWPRGLRYISFGGPSPKLAEWPAFEAKFRREEDPESLYRLGDLGLVQGKRISVHWFLENALVAVASDGTLASTLPTIAAAVGAKVVNQKDGSLYLDVPADVFRDRMIASLETERRELLQTANSWQETVSKGKRVRVRNSVDPFDLVDLETAVQGWRAAPLEKIREALKSQDHILLPAPPRSPLGQAVLRRLNAYAKRQDISLGFNQPTPAQLVENVDFEKPIEMRLNIRGGLSSMRAAMKGRDDAQINF
jgi:hypothetical protein